MKKRLPVSADIKQFRFVSDPQVSPDGKSVLFVVTRMIDDGEMEIIQATFGSAQTERSDS